MMNSQSFDKAPRFDFLEDRSDSPEASRQARRSGPMRHINLLFDQQIALLEQAKMYCKQASHLGTRCTMGARILSQQLKEAG